MSASITHVVAGILFNRQGEVLLSSRPQGKAYAGYWEFAGGKIEAGESELAALQREFAEELGIEILTATPWLTKVHAYEHATVRLRFFRVADDQWRGTLQARENQQWAWQRPGSYTVAPMLPANAPLLAAVALPQHFSGSLSAGFNASDFQTSPLDCPTKTAQTPFISVQAAAKLPEILSDPAHHGAPWLLVRNAAEFTFAAGRAAAVVWHADNPQSAAELTQTLIQGTPVPLLACTRSALRHSEWQPLGLHAWIEDKSNGNAG